MSRLRWLGTSHEDLSAFPEAARCEAGHQLWQVEIGLDPDDWKPMPSIGQGVREIRVREANGAFRVIYVTNIDEHVYVLHAFQKKTRSTPKRDLELARRRLQELRQ